MEHNDKIKKAFWITEDMDREIDAHLKLDNCSSRSTAVDLASAMSELEAHEGNVWTIIYSLRREDTDRLEYDNADAWRALLMENAPTLAKSMKISLEIGSGERMEMQLIDGGLAVVEVPNENSVTIDNESGTTNVAVMFEEGDSVTAVVLGDESEFDTDEYTVNVNYGNETVSYKLKDLIEMAEK